MAVISSNVNADVIIIGAEKSLISTINILSLYFQLVIMPKTIIDGGGEGVSQYKVRRTNKEQCTAGQPSGTCSVLCSSSCSHNI